MALKTLIKIKSDFISLVYPDYIKNKIKDRKGKCKQCGKCCEDCKYLSKGKKCTIYKNRPWRTCYKEFPLSKFEQRVWKTEKCGYSFPEK